MRSCSLAEDQSRCSANGARDEKLSKPAESDACLTSHLIRVKREAEAGLEPSSRLRVYEPESQMESLMQIPEAEVTLAHSKRTPLSPDPDVEKLTSALLLFISFICLLNSSLRV
ncbi:hypothetical protein PO909_022086 [Leuciscus waleckii]